MTSGHVVIAIQWAMLADDDRVECFFNQTLHCTRFRSLNARRIYMVIADAGPAMSKLAHHDRIQGENWQQCHVFVLALSAKDKKNVSALANSPSNFLKHVEVRTEYYYRIHSKPSCFIASNKWDARNYISLIVHSLSTGTLGPLYCQ